MPQNHGTKRGRNGGSPELSVQKRVRPNVDITSLSPAQVAILSQAAAILQVDVPNLPKALGDQSRYLESDNWSHATPEPALIHQQIPAMEAISPQSKSSAKTTKFKSKVQSGSNHVTHGAADDNDICDLPSFGLDLIPKQITDCFAGFTPSTPRITLPTNSQGESQDALSYYTDMACTDSSLLDRRNNQLSSPSLRYNLQTPGTSTEINPLNSDFSHNAFHPTYACDLFTPGAEEWLTNNGQRPISQYTQPYISPPSMVYPLEDNAGGEEDLISLGGEFEFRKAPSFSDVPDQLRSFLVPEIDPLDQSKPQTPNLEASQSMQRLIATPRRKFQSADDRQKTAQTRKLTACVRCRMQRIRCEPDSSNLKGACLTCQRVMKPTVHKLPCLRYKLTEIRLFREGSYAAGREWSHRWSNNNMDNITAWATPGFKKIRVTQDYGPTALEFTVRQFVPMDGDMLHRQWSDGDITKSVAIPNYAIVDMAAALQVHKDFIINEGPQFFKSTLDYNDRLLWDTYSTAIRFSNSSKSSDEREVLQMVLQLWVTVRMTTRSVRITGAETLGMSSDLMDKSSGMQGKIPIPPVLGAQMQFIITHKLQAPLRSKILVRLQMLTLEQKPNHWFCIYLCTFILLHNCSLLTAHDIGYARKHGLKTRHARPGMIKELHLGANVLLAHFHYGCKGYRPFALDEKLEECTSMAVLDDEQLRFVRQTAAYVDYNGPRFHKLLSEGAYENEHYFVAQMYENEWKPRFSVE